MVNLQSIICWSALITCITASPAVEKLYCLVNQERAKYGLKPLSLNSKLNSAAHKHSEDQAFRLGYLSHTGSDRSNPGERISRVGFQWRKYGENVAKGYSNAVQVMRQWMKSPRFTHFGAGYVVLEAEAVQGEWDPNTGDTKRHSLAIY
ncbi:hypothetical protein K493DRAFT_297167 [Basidiobolus meristosporus CBS 931.73]|uniref:SCP domain-containing protein n=1 Tax=Basidiobolus meristosporus CBS 931.73 TaxID=1314790 RepID=A0A1Y1Z1M7_9FUNG|nr:hypothetical protein K493DRAFT_297167 [Basidiobolus meristosporus CBS 931.73]|eukprot:ORY04086.1 hypothetical protein K493DRAFT_297167 [Basidiobolus meristosporus CBS 931.73]